jgi:alcohol dehydrogenase
MRGTYRAVVVTAPGRLDLVERETPTPGPGEVLIAVEACGLCGADANDIERSEGPWPRVPGHEDGRAHPGPR